MCIKRNLFLTCNWSDNEDNFFGGRFTHEKKSFSLHVLQVGLKMIKYDSNVPVRTMRTESYPCTTDTTRSQSDQLNPVDIIFLRGDGTEI